MRFYRESSCMPAGNKNALRVCCDRLFSMTNEVKLKKCDNGASAEGAEEWYRQALADRRLPEAREQRFADEWHKGRGDAKEVRRLKRERDTAVEGQAKAIGRMDGDDKGGGKQ